MTHIPNLNPVAYIIRNETFTRSGISVLHELLDAKEKARSRKFLALNDRESYVIVHGLLRRILGKHLGVPGSSLHFLTSPLGKPRLILPGRNIFFNLSHSAELSVIAFDMHHEIGADVEKIVPWFDHQGISERYFKKADKEYIQNSGKDKVSAFYEIWTRKEALLKAAGLGIGKFLDVEVTGKKSYRIPGNNDSDRIKRKFALTTQALDHEYIASVATDPASGEVAWEMIGKTEMESIITD